MVENRDFLNLNVTLRTLLHVNQKPLLREISKYMDNLKCIIETQGHCLFIGNIQIDALSALKKIIQRHIIK